MTREEFEILLKRLFNWASMINTTEVLAALVTNDEQLLIEYEIMINDAQERIDFYLTEWDEASTPEEKQAVVESVTV